jgi:hypothetical protein
MIFHSIPFDPQIWGYGDSIKLEMIPFDTSPKDFYYLVNDSKHIINYSVGCNSVEMFQTTNEVAAAMVH